MEFIGFLGKLLAESIEEIDETQAEAIRATGASWWQVVNYGVQPQVMPRLLGLSLYRLDINFRESAVIGVPHPDFGESVVGVLVARDDAVLDIDAIRAATAKALAKFKQPQRLFVLPELPRNTMGKVQKNVLRETYAGTFTG